MVKHRQPSNHRVFDTEDKPRPKKKASEQRKNSRGRRLPCTNAKKSALPFNMQFEQSGGNRWRKKEKNEETARAAIQAKRRRPSLASAEVEASTVLGRMLARKLGSHSQKWPGSECDDLDEGPTSPEENRRATGIRFALADREESPGLPPEIQARLNADWAAYLKRQGQPLEEDSSESEDEERVGRSLSEISDDWAGYLHGQEMEELGGDAADSEEETASAPRISPPDISGAHIDIIRSGPSLTRPRAMRGRLRLATPTCRSPSPACRSTRRESTCGSPSPEPQGRMPSLYDKLQSTR
ncbi:hypothetical protein C8R44DRAFT_755233 [Mycena epipterygia]|nr:hypothetical protein C8R44DRAFT_755233 [Mycena epipterygia]